MSSRRLIAIFGLIGLAAFAFICWRLQHLKRIQGQLAERVRYYQGLRVQFDALAKRRTAAHDRVFRPSAGESPSGAKALRPLDWTQTSRALAARNPDLRKAYLKGYLAGLYSKWGLFFKRMGLSQDQIARFIAIQMTLENAQLDVIAVAENEGASLDDPAITAAMKQANSDEYSGIKALLGPDGMPSYKSYSQNLSALTLVSDLATRIPDASDQLTDDQVDQLTQILADASERKPNGWVQYGTVNWDTAMPQAQGMLTAAQYSALETLEAQKIAQWRTARILGGVKN